MATAPESRGEHGPTAQRLSAGSVVQEWVTILFMLPFAVGWNAMFWLVMLPKLWFSAHDAHGMFHWGLELMLLMTLPFVCVGAASALFTIYLFLKLLFTPRVRVTIAPAVLSPGDSLRVQWTVTSRERLLDLRFGLECREEVLGPPRGKNHTRSLHCTQRKVLPLWEMADVDAEGDRRANLPAYVLDVIAREGGDLRWYLTVRGRVAWLPDVADDLAVTVQRFALMP